MDIVTQLREGSADFLDAGRVVDQLDIRENMSLADFGCGSGFFTVALAKRAGAQGKVYAVDVQEAPLESVRSKTQAEGLTNVQTLRGNLEAPRGSGLPDGSIDLVLIKNVLFQSQKKEDILREAKRVLKDGGQLAVLDWKKGAGGGPPDNLRTEEGVIREMIQGLGFKHELAINAGSYHFGMIFRK